MPSVYGVPGVLTRMCPVTGDRCAPGVGTCASHGVPPLPGPVLCARGVLTLLHASTHPCVGGVCVWGAACWRWCARRGAHPKFDSFDYVSKDCSDIGDLADGLVCYEVLTRM